MHWNNVRRYYHPNGCVYYWLCGNGPGEALVSDLGVTGGNKKSGYYLDGERQKERFDNDAIIDQLEAKIRAKLHDKIQKIELFKENSWQKIFKQFVG